METNTDAVAAAHHRPAAAAALPRAPAPHLRLRPRNKNACTHLNMCTKLSLLARYTHI